MGYAQFADPLGGGPTQSSTINVPAVGATTLTGAAQAYAAVEVFKGASTTPLGTALADAQGVWALTLAVAAALNDIFRTAAGGVVVTAQGGTSPPGSSPGQISTDLSDPNSIGPRV